jgi:uncharacterized membrane protein
MSVPASAPATAGPGDLSPATHRTMSAVLRVGLAVALALLAGGIVALTVRSAGTGSGGWIASNPLVRYLDLRRLGAGLADGSPEAYLTVGVFAMIATPVVRVAAGIRAFVGHGERRMAALTGAVLALLLVGLLVVGPLVR